MRKTWTITVDVEDNELAGDFEERADEMEYWTDITERHIQGIMHEYNRLVDRSSIRVNFEVIDFTTISVVRSDSGDYTEDI